MQPEALHSEPVQTEKTVQSESSDRSESSLRREAGQAASLASVEPPASGLADDSEQSEDRAEVGPQLAAAFDSLLADAWSSLAQGGDASSSGTGRGSSGAGAGDGGGHGPAGGTAGSRGPVLVANSARCEDFFPFSAKHERGEVTVAVTVDESGRTLAAQILHSSSADFRQAARACARRMVFQPATDERGSFRRGQATLTLRFDRHS